MAQARWMLITDMWRRYQWLYGLAGFLAGMLTFPLLRLVADNLDNLLQALVPEAVGIAFTVLFVDALYRRREQARHYHQLVRRVGSRTNEVALTAVEELRVQGWLTGLSGQVFQRANLQNADLQSMNLARAKFVEANFEDANLHSVILSEADIWKASFKRANMTDVRLENAFAALTDFSAATLSGATFSGADLKFADFDGADLSGARFDEANMLKANFQKADLWKADLSRSTLIGADFSGATMRHTILSAATMDATTILPDGSHWTPATDMTRFGCIVIPD